MSKKEKIAEAHRRYPIVSGEVDGRKVLGNIDNISSVSASLYEYEILDGVREFPMNLLKSDPYSLFYAADDIARVQELSQAIAKSKQISPLIVVIDDEGPYILEGAHRLGALHLLSANSFPAIIVIDFEKVD